MPELWILTTDDETYIHSKFLRLTCFVISAPTKLVPNLSLAISEYKKSSPPSD